MQVSLSSPETGSDETPIPCFCSQDALTAFHVMDKNRDGVVNWRDFRELFESLQFVIKNKEYQRLVDLMGFQNGATLNYAEFFELVHRSSQEDGPLLSVTK